MKRKQPNGQQTKLRIFVEVELPDASILQPISERTVPSAGKKTVRLKGVCKTKNKTSITKTTYKRAQERWKSR